MTTAGILILITALCTLATALVGLFTSLRNRSTMKRLEVNVDGRLGEFMDLIKKSAHAEGKLEGEANTTAKK